MCVVVHRSLLKSGNSNVSDINCQSKGFIKSLLLFWINGKERTSATTATRSKKNAEESCDILPRPALKLYRVIETLNTENRDECVA